MMIIAGQTSQLLAGRVANILNAKLAVCEYKLFPDKEQYIRVLDEIQGDVAIIQSTPADSDYISLLQMIDACDGADSISVVIPYMGYARQDKRFKSGEPVSARAMAKGVHADRVITVNVHSPQILEYFTNAQSAVNLDAAPLIGNYIKNLHLKNPIIIAPDDGAIYIAKNAAADLDIDYDYLEKTRISGDTVTMAPKNLDVKSRDVIMIDDIISTGGTMAETVSMLKSQGAEDVYSACIHPVLVGNAISKLFRMGVKDIIATDTLEKGVSRISIAGIVSDVLKNSKTVKRVCRGI